MSTPAPRLGPRPLALHLGSALAIWMSSQAALPLARNGSLAWKAALAKRAAALRPRLASEPLAELGTALGREALERFAGLVAGIERYRAHPYRRDVPSAPVIWGEGASRLYDYGPHEPGPRARAGLSVLFVPSLVNRGYILDLSPRRSLLRWLASRGVHPFLLEWGEPGEAERGFGFDQYIAGRLVRALDALAARDPRPVVLAGYCMGGLMALALAARRADIAGLALLATPWDFHAEAADAARRLGAAAAAFEPAFVGLGSVPVDFLQALFASLDPTLVARKFRAFAALDSKSAQARDFVALEDWVNDGIALTLPVARTVFGEWYGENRPARGLWRVAGRAVRPRAFARPALALVPEKDRIVPPEGALALATELPRGEAIRVPFGHVGLVASAEAPKAVWPHLLRFIEGLGAETGKKTARKNKKSTSK